MSLSQAKMKNINVFKSKQNYRNLEHKIYAKIASNHIFKENTIDLIIDFLE